MAKAKKLPSGNWNIQIFVGYDKDGKKIRKSFTAPTKREVEFMAAEFKAKHKEVFRDKSAMTLSEGIDKYIEFKGSSLSPSTVRSYRITQRNAFPRIMKMKMNVITVTDIQAAINDEIGRKKPKTIKNEYGLVQSVFKMYAPDVSLNGIKLPQKEKFEAQQLTRQEVVTLLKAIKAEPDQYSIPLLLGICGGLRSSEIIGLTWENYIPQKQMIYIKSAIVPDEHNRLVKKTTKNTSSTRSFEIPRTLSELLDKNTGESQAPIVTISQKAIRLRLHKLCRLNNIPIIRIHDLRHINASVMLFLDIPQKYAMERGGWTDIQTMDKIYQFTFEDEKKAVDDKINNFFDAALNST